MVLLLDIGNTNTHIGLANEERVFRHRDIPTHAWSKDGRDRLQRFLAGTASKVKGAGICSVVPNATPAVISVVESELGLRSFELKPGTLKHVGVDYPKPLTIGPDRLANAAAARYHFGAPAVVVDFGTAVTFDVVDGNANYVGGIIAPGLAAMTDYLHEKTALLPRIRIAEVDGAIGKSTRDAMLIGAVHGYRGLVRELIMELKRELNVRRLPVIATGGYAGLIASKLPEITAVEPLLTLEGIRLCYFAAES